MFNTLIDRQNRDVAGSRQAPVIEQLLKADDGARRTIRSDENSIHEIGAGQVQYILRNFALMREQTLGFIAEYFLNSSEHVPPYRPRFRRANTIVRMTLMRMDVPSGK